jgi:hypothetical protein
MTNLRMKDLGFKMRAEQTWLCDPQHRSEHRLNGTTISHLRRTPLLRDKYSVFDARGIIRNALHYIHQHAFGAYERARNISVKLFSPCLMCYPARSVETKSSILSKSKESRIE